MVSHVHHIFYSWLSSYVFFDSEQEPTWLPHSHIPLPIVVTTLPQSDHMLPLDTLLVKPTSTSNSIATSSEPHHDSLLPDDTMTALVVPTTCEFVSSTVALEPQSHPAPVHHSMTTQSQSGVFKPNLNKS